METIESIEKNCRAWATEYLGGNFSFRPHQLEHIVSTLDGVLNGKTKTQALEAPTGSGKSLIAMITCGTLAKHYGKRSYILVSDLGLLEQYAKDFQKYRLPWGVIKGAENYTCMKNDCPFPLGECRMARVAYPVLMNSKLAFGAGYPCADSCEYIQARKRAIDAPVTLMTYQFFLIQRNTVAPTISPDQEEPFPKRDFLVADEAHKLSEIVQSQYSPVIDSANLEKISQLLNCAEEIGAYPSPESTNLFKLRQGTMWPPVSYFEKMMETMRSTENKESLYKALEMYVGMVHYLVDVDNALKDILQDGADPKQFRKQLFLGSWASDLCSRLSEYCALIQSVGTEYLIKNPTDTKITFNCIYEDKMVQNYFHRECGNELLMSATIGNPDVFKTAIGATDYKFSKIPSTFDFSRSPIMFLNKYRMSYKEKDQNMSDVCRVIDQICRDHSGLRGIIQTGSYDFTGKLMQRVSPQTRARLLNYAISKERDEAIQRFLSRKDGILIGPTLIEGLNFPDDQCRFMVCMKIPYASLADNLVKAKMEYIPDWYSANVCSRLEQGFGRGVRHEKDWCETYVVDACFNDLLSRCPQNLSEETRSRIKTVSDL